MGKARRQVDPFQGSTAGLRSCHGATSDVQHGIISWVRIAFRFPYFVSLLRQEVCTRCSFPLPTLPSHAPNFSKCRSETGKKSSAQPKAPLSCNTRTRLVNSFTTSVQNTTVLGKYSSNP